MKVHSFNTIKKYTKALLDTFNDIYVKRVRSDNSEAWIRMPVVFASKDPAYLLNEAETKQLLTGNVNFLPRASLSLETLEPLGQSRALSRIDYMTLNGDKRQFLYNSFGADMVFQLIIETRSLTELLSIVETILPFFTPTLNLKIDELDGLQEPTTIPVEYQVLDIQLPMPENNDLKICSAVLRMKLRGNIYPPIKDPEVIKYIEFIIGTNKNELDGVLKVDENTEIPSFVEPSKVALEGVILDKDTMKIIPTIASYINEKDIFTITYNLIYNENKTSSISNDGILQLGSKCIVQVQLVFNDKTLSNIIELTISRDENGEIISNVY